MATDTLFQQPTEADGRSFFRGRTPQHGPLRPRRAAAVDALRNRCRRPAADSTPFSWSASWSSCATSSATSAIWQHEFVSFSLIGATFIGAPYVLMTKRPCQRRPARPLPVGAETRRCLDRSCSPPYCHHGLLRPDRLPQLSAGGGRPGPATGTTRRSGPPPLWIPYAAMPIGMTLLTLQAIADIAGSGFRRLAEAENRRRL